MHVPINAHIEFHLRLRFRGQIGWCKWCCLKSLSDSWIIAPYIARTMDFFAILSREFLHYCDVNWQGSARNRSVAAHHRHDSYAIWTKMQCMPPRDTSWDKWNGKLNISNQVARMPHQQHSARFTQPWTHTFGSFASFELVNVNWLRVSLPLSETHTTFRKSISFEGQR